MTYKHLTTRELTLIADFWFQGTKGLPSCQVTQTQSGNHLPHLSFPR